MKSTAFGAARIAALLAFVVLVQPVSAEGSSARILICLDGVPYSMMEKLRAEGKFDGFGRPAPLLSTFPAITELMLTAFYHAEQPPGYGLRYYDRAKNELVGGLADQDAISIWYNFYDYITPMFDRGVTYVWGRWGHMDLDMVKYHIEKTDSGTLVMHLDSTDALMHHEKPYVTERLLESLSELLSSFRAENPGAEIVLFSDHGNEMLPTRRVQIEKWLKKEGYKVAGVIKGDSGVALLPTGLISTGYMYTHRPAEVAERLIGMPGLELALYESGGIVHVRSESGFAAIEVSADSTQYRYRALEGDPLQLSGIVDRMREAGSMGSDGFATDRAWFDATVDHLFPDVLNRAYRGVTGHVENVGDVFISLKPGWHCGSTFLSYIVHFEGTHGSLRKDSLYGFIMSSGGDLPPLRAEEALRYLGWEASIREHAARKGIMLGL